MTTQEEFDRRIAGKEAALKEQVDQLEALRKQFIPVATKFVASWWTSAAKSEVERGGATTDALTNEQLSKLKSQVHGLCAEAQKHVEEFFSDGKVWWHLLEPLVDSMHSSDGKFYYFMNGNRGPDEIDRPLRFVLGKLAPILESYGYLSPKGLRTHGDDRWREYDRSGNNKLPNGRPYFPYSLDWPKEFTPIVEAYSERKRAAERLLQEIASLRREKKQAADGKRWDSA